MTKNLFKENFALKETQCTIISDKLQAIQAAIEAIKRNRQELEIYIKANPKFLYTLKPFPAPEKPLIAKLMALAAEKAGVGPTLRTGAVGPGMLIDQLLAGQGKVVATLRLGAKPVNTATALSRSFKVPTTWRAGTYRYFVYATDKALNAQALPAGSNKLVVK